MAKRKKIDWPVIFAEQKKSGQTIAVFCNERGIHPTNFYKNKRKHEDINFIELKSLSSESKKKTLSTGQPIALKIQDYSIELHEGFNKTLLTELLTVLKECN